MTKKVPVDSTALRSIFNECRQCGTCCRSYRKITLHPDEVDFIRKMGGHVGVKVSLVELRDHSMDDLVAAAKSTGKVFMIHPDDRGCIFLQKKNDKHRCRIYHHRPRACRGFRCNLADSSFLDLFGTDSIFLLGQDRFGLPMVKK